MLEASSGVAARRKGSIGVKTLRVPITKNQYTLIDESDAEFVTAHRWYALPSKNGTFYVARSGRRLDGERGTFLLHRELMKAEPGETVDHINGDKLDNRRSNLRIATPSQNLANRGLQRNNTTGYKGVFQSPKGRWIAQAKYRGKHLRVGTFDTVEEAVAAFDAKIIELFGEFARPNRTSGKGLS